MWLHKPGLPPRCVVKIKNPENGRIVFCEALQFDDNFLQQYNQDSRHKIDSKESSIVMSGWYRARLGGLETQREYALEITDAHSCWGKMRTCMHHPQTVVRVAVWLGLLSLALGLVGMVLGIVSVWPRG